MPLTLEQTTVEALSLAEKERAQLAHVLIASLEQEEGDFTEEWDAEIARRVAEIDNGTAKGRPVADVLREIRARYR
ncbi:MAG: hypothetical protein A3K19_32825 [Lentisphaerae bacterium RIFOXYB12_FULL_65_16]|nr:MAG: hypothetical protein A3K18_20325 [Lentisphaerae bacterium RIFOXYA12_64_32]OGV84528.1 MAG: hypothetical protein A3K19_32825 [Lentisphaerae bacterium RIFOXYB12_FULL_65_16]